MRPIIYAVDFDGTLSLDAHWPDIGRPNRKLFQMLIDERKKGNKVILWTCRENDSGLQEAIKWCKAHCLEFDAVNENLPEIPFHSRKIVADIYIDDLAMTPQDAFYKSLSAIEKIPLNHEFGDSKQLI